MLFPWNGHKKIWNDTLDKQKRTIFPMYQYGPRHSLKKVPEQRMTGLFPWYETSWWAIAVIIIILTVSLVDLTQKGAFIPFEATMPPQVNTPLKTQMQAPPELTVAEQIGVIAQKEGFSVDTLLNIGYCESQLNPEAIGGDDGCFHGIWQWNTCATKIISVECAHNIECSTIATIDALKRGEQWRWPNCIE